MKHDKLFLLFREIFPTYIDHSEVKKWVPIRKDSIAITYENGVEVVFTYEDKTHWRLETLDHFIDHEVEIEGRKR